MSDAPQGNEILKKISDIYALLSNLSVGHPETAKDFENFREEFSDKILESSLECYKKEQSKTLKSLEDRILHFQEYHLSMAASVESLKKELLSLKSFVQEGTPTNESVSFVFLKLEEKLTCISNDIYATLHSNVQQVRQELYKKIDELPIPSENVTKEQVIGLINVNMEPTSLDARNALLTSRNHDLRLSIVEKKVENSLLQLKNMELNNV